MSLILGSSSPRRVEILSYFTIPFVQATSHFDEESIPFTGDPSGYVAAISEAKGRALEERFKEDLILTADTTVYFQGEIFPKPKDVEDAFKMLRRLAGETHEVYTAITLTERGEQETSVAKTSVTLTDLTDEQIRAYQRRCHAWDKAAGYAIQGVGALIVDRIDGCYYNVMGLPVQNLHELLLKRGVNLWDSLL